MTETKTFIVFENDNSNYSFVTDATDLKNAVELMIKTYGPKRYETKLEVCQVKFNKEDQQLEYLDNEKIFYCYNDYSLFGNKFDICESRRTNFL